MMLTAIPANPSSSLFVHNRTPPLIAVSSLQPTPPHQVQGGVLPSTTHILRGMDAGKAISDSSSVSSGPTPPPPPPPLLLPQNHSPAHIIPMSAMQQPFLVGTGGGGYTLVPSIQHLGNLSGVDGHFLGLQPLSAISALSRAGTTAMQPLAAMPSGYYGRLHPEAAPLGFQQAMQQLPVAGLSLPTQLSTASAAARPPSPTPSGTIPQHHHHHHLLSSGSGNGVLLNGAANLEAKSGLDMEQPPEAGVIYGRKVSVLTSPSPSSSSSSSSPSTSSSQKSSLEKANSSSVPDVCHRSSLTLNGAESPPNRRRTSHDAHLSYSRSRAARHAARSNTSSPPPSSDAARLARVKREPSSAGDDPPPLRRHPRRNSDSTLEESVAAPSSSSSYQISALIDIPPMAPPLNRASRTSSLSSSLSSFRFGGSLSQLWASQISLSGKINNMKSTGNINADAAVMPSLGNQYFAFGGSLPELSLTSLTRLLPNSSANDPGMSSCPGLFTLPLYVYPSQQHLATPFINTHGSISFGSFLSSGSSLCSTSKGPMGGSASSNVSTNAESNAESGDDKSEGCGQAGSSASLLQQESVIKLPVYNSPPAGTLLRGNTPSVITSLPGFTSLTRGMEPNSMDVSNSNHSIANITSTRHNSTTLPGASTLVAATTSSPSVTISHGLHEPCVSAGSPGNHTHHHHHHTMHHGQAPARSHMHASPAHSSTPDMDTTPLSPPVRSDLYVGAGDGGVLQTVPISSIKLERDLDPQELSPAHGLPITPHEGHTSHNLASTDSVKGVKREREKPYKCDHPGCARSFSFPAHLRSHIQQIHISYRPCKCEFPGCGKRFYTPQHLNVHRRVHTGERPFVCPYSECSKAFTTAGNLKNHIRTHTGERPYACKFEGCSKRFAEMSSLKKHELTHTGEKPYKCRVCGKAFSQAGSRNTHERKHSRATTVGGAAAAATEDEEATKGGASSKKYRIKRVSGKGSEEEEPMEQ